MSESGTLLALFYKHSVDCVIRVAYAVERDPLAVVETKVIFFREKLYSALGPAGFAT